MRVETQSRFDYALSKTPIFAAKDAAKMGHPASSRRYNMRVAATPPNGDHKHHRHAVYASETTGLLLIAFLLLVLTLVRYWHDLHWSLR
jgi:hypothetical protein